MKPWLLIIIGLCSICAILLFVNQRKTKQKTFSVRDVEQLFARSADEINLRVARVKDEALRQTAVLLTIPSTSRSFANTAQAFDDIYRSIFLVQAPLEIIAEVDPSTQLRDAAGRTALELARFSQKLLITNKKIYEAFQSYIAGNAKTEKLSDEQRYFLSEMMRVFKKNGLNLPDYLLEQVRLLNTELAQLTLQFGKNISEDPTQVLCTADELQGLPGYIIDGLARTSDGSYVVGVDQPTVAAILKSAHNERTRKKVYEAFGRKAYPKNYDIIKQLVAKRRQLAQLLGYSSYAALDIDGEMAEKPEVARTFLENLNARLQPKLHKEFAELLRHIPPGVPLTAQKKLQPWDVSYVYESYKKKMFNLDDTHLMEYFSVDQVLQGLCCLMQSFLPLRFERVPQIRLWHEDVFALAVYDTATNALRGYLLLDLYQRAGKYPYACELEAISAQCIQGVCSPAVVLIIANAPRRINGQPGLQTFEDVATLIHEFGHAMHALLSATRMYAFAGVVVKTDFSEAPSQLFERFLFDPQVLKRLAKHHRTGEPLSDEMIKNIVKIEQLDAGYVHGLLAGRALFLLDLYEQGLGDIDALYRKYVGSIASDYVAQDKSVHFAAGFLHVPEYGPKYYSYLWSKVFSADMYDVIIQRGGLCNQVGKRFADDILSKAGSVDPAVLLERFLGRHWRIEPLLVSWGLS